MKPVIMDREELVRTALHFQMLQHPYPQHNSSILTSISNCTIHWIPYIDDDGDDDDDGDKVKDADDDSDVSCNKLIIQIKILCFIKIIA